MCGAPGVLLFHWWEKKTTQPRVTQRPAQRRSQQLYSQRPITRKCLLTGEWISKLWYGQTKEYHSATKSKELIQAATWVNLKIILLGKTKKKDMRTLYSSFIWNSRKRELSSNGILEQGRENETGSFWGWRCSRS